MQPSEFAPIGWAELAVPRTCGSGQVSHRRAAGVRGTLAPAHTCPGRKCRGVQANGVETLSKHRPGVIHAHG